MLRRALLPPLLFCCALVAVFVSVFAAGRARADEAPTATPTVPVPIPAPTPIATPAPTPVTTISTRLTAELTLGAGWRTSFDASDRSPGFEAVGGGGEVVIGMAWGGIALLAGARARVGATLSPQRNPNGSLIGGPGVPSGGFYWEGAGSLSVQIYLGERIRARLGADVGRAFIRDPMTSGELSAPLVGGFVAFGLETIRFASGRFAGIFVLRLDIDALLTDDDHFPRLSSSLSAGIGFRY